MRAKLITIFMISFAAFAAVLVWRADQLLFGDKLSWSEAQSRAQMSAVVHALNGEVQSLSDILNLGFSEIEMAKKDFPAGKAYSKFQMVAKILPPNLKDDKKDWQIVSSFFQEKTSVKSWASSYIGLALKTVKETDIKPGSTNVYALMDPSRKPFLLFVSHGNGNWYAGLAGPQVFQGLTDRQKGQLSSLFVVNMQGQALAHTTPEYVGNLLTEDPLVQEAMKSSLGSGAGVFRDLRGESVQGFYEQIGSSNLYAVITTPLTGLTKNRNQVKMQFAMMAGGLCLLGLALFVLVYKETAPAPKGLAAYPMAPVGPQTVSAPKVSEQPTAPMKAYVKVASSLSHELKSPLTSILGHAQLAGHEITDGKAKEHLDKIEQEARSARDIIQKLLIFAGEDKFTSSKVGLETVLNKALKNVEGKTLSKGIKLTKNIHSVPPFTMASDLIVKALESILQNAIEAMERAPKKEMTVSLKAEGSVIDLSVTDTGEGIAAQDLEKIFDPFFTTRSGTQHVGLGLSTAMGILKESFGEIQVQSEKGKGTTVSIRFTPQDMMKSAEAIPAATPPVAPAKAGVPSMARPATNTHGIADDMTVDLPSLKAKATFNDELTVGLDPLLVNNAIDKLIDGEDDEVPLKPDPLADKKLAADAVADLPPAPKPEFSDEQTMDMGVYQQGGHTSKIDKPKMEIKKKASKLDSIQVAVRRPGDKQ